MFIFLQLMCDESALSENRIVRDECWRDLRLALLRSFLLRSSFGTAVAGNH